ncbi:protein FAM186A [Amblyraja radiata]|uniref:protein FAM186A n=1 Tax=Amblyraja radiata TaxID=386614 RepID=UPI0014030603|nr:protein FAM186A [Amblyraja radiata]
MVENRNLDQILIDEEEMEEDEELEKLSTEWIAEVNLKVQSSLASSQTCIDYLYFLSKALFRLQRRHLKSRSTEPGDKQPTGKRWKQKKMESKSLVYFQDMQPMSTATMLEPHIAKQLEAAVGEINIVFTNITKYLPFKKVQTIAFRYIGKFIGNLYKAFLARSHEYFEVENELRKADSFGSQRSEGNLVTEVKGLQEHSCALKTRAELAEYHYREVSSMNRDLEKNIKCLRSKIEQLQNGEKVTADLLVSAKQVSKTSKSKALVKKSKHLSSEEPKNIIFDRHDTTTDQRVIPGENIPIGESEEQKAGPEVSKKENIPFDEPTGESIPKELTIGRITPIQTKFETVLSEAVKGKMFKSNSNAGKNQRAWVQKEELKTQAQQMVVDLLTDFQTAVLYSLDHGLRSGKDLAPDDICKVHALLKSEELKNLYEVIEKTIKEISMQKLKQEPKEQPVQDRKPLEENLAEISKEREPDLTNFAELLEEVSRFGIIQEIALDELSAQVQYLIEEAKQDQSLSQEETHFHEKTLQALDTILTLEKMSSRAGMDQLIRIRETISNIYSSNSALELNKKEVKLQAECYKEGASLPETPSATPAKIIQPSGNVLQAAEGEKVVDLSYIVNVTYLRSTCKTLDQAVCDGIISRQLHTTATHLIHKTLSIIQLRLAYLFRKYMAFRQIEIFRKYLNSRLLDLSNKDDEVPKALYRFASRLKTRLISTMRHWETRQQLINQSRQRHLNQMINVFSQVKHHTGLVLLSPFLATRSPDTKMRKQFGPPFQPTLVVASERPCCPHGQGNGTPSTLLRTRNTHLWSTNIVDGSFPIAKKDPATPVMFPATPKLVTMDGRKNSFRQMVTNTQMSIVGESLHIPTKSLPIPSESYVPLFLDKNMAFAIATSSNKFNFFQQA